MYFLRTTELIFTYPITEKPKENGYGAPFVPTHSWITASKRS